MGILSIFLESAEMAEMLAELEQMSAMTSLLSDLISLAISIFMCVVMWKINVKAGEPGWACLIPFYSSWVDCKVAKKKWLFDLFNRTKSIHLRIVKTAYFMYW